MFNSTNVQSGALWRFMKPYMRDWRVGEIKRPTVTLARVVAASSAFPPVLSPTAIDLSEMTFTPQSGADLQREPFTSQAVLTDGGVYDNLGLETAWKRYRTILVSDGGGQMDEEGNPKRNWIGHTVRVFQLVDHQVRSLRKRQLIGSFTNGAREGAYWSVRSKMDNFGRAAALACPEENTNRLANVETRLKRLDNNIQERLINWGYASCDAALRKHVDADLSIPNGFPYSAGV